MILNIEHDILVSGPDLETCEHHARLYFAKSQLVHYDSMELDQENSMNAVDPRFKDLVDKGIGANRRVLTELLVKLQNEGYATLQDVLSLPQGYQSKLLHTMSHLLDGFFGIDSKLYDIDEMSHWLTESRREELTKSPQTCWLLRVKAHLVYGQGFEKKEND